MTIDQLFQAAQSLNYTKSNGMTKVSAMKGPGFFPGCVGTVDGDKKRTQFPYMVLGQDFDTEENHKKVHEINGEVNSNTTWRNLKTLLKDLGITATDCFYTNAYMGLRPGSPAGKMKNTGQSPAAKSADFSAICHQFFKEQLKMIQPKYVLVLGKETAKFIVKCFPDAFPHWANLDTLKEFYQDPSRIAQSIKVGETEIKFIFVIHPSLNNTNRALIWGKEAGKTKEQELLKVALNDYNI